MSSKLTEFFFTEMDKTAGSGQPTNIHIDLENTSVGDTGISSIRKRSIFPVTPFLQNLVSAPAGIDRFTAFMRSTYNVLNANTTNSHLNNFMSNFQNLFVSKGLSAFSLLYTLQANLWTVIDGIANIVRLTEGRYLNRRDRVKELTAEDPLAELKALFNVTTINLADFTSLVRDFACNPDGDINAIPTECLDLEENYDDVIDEEISRFDNRVDSVDRSVQSGRRQQTQLEARANNPFDSSNVQYNATVHHPDKEKLGGHVSWLEVLPGIAINHRAPFNAKRHGDTHSPSPRPRSLPFHFKSRRA